MESEHGTEADREDEGDWEYTVEDYVRIEQESELLKHEYVNGQVRAMSGGTFEHGRLAMAFAFQAQLQLRGRPCAVISSDSRVRIKSANVITYPDLSIVCVRSIMDLQDPYAQTNPTVVAEVTSKSSERYDRNKKRLYYQQLESLREYVIVSQREKAIDVYTRAEDGSWGEPARSGAGQKARLHSVDCEIDVDEVYTNPLAS